MVESLIGDRFQKRWPQSNDVTDALYGSPSIYGKYLW